jgi:putative oxidoreductase
MKVTALIARYLLGLIFVVFGLNGLHPFLPMGPLPSGIAGQYLSALTQSHYSEIVALLQVIGGALLLVNRYVPLALAILGPIIVNIVLFHVLMAPAGVAPAIVVVILWLILFYRNRQYFEGLFVQRTE